VTVTIISPGDRHVSLTTTLAPPPGGPRIKNLDIIVSGAHAPFRILSAGQTLRIPLELHTGLNRFELTLTGPGRRSPAPTALVLLQNIELSG
jgi:hypothetical protein